MDLDEDLTRLRLGNVDVFVAQYLGTAVLVYADCFQNVPPVSNPVFSVATIGS